VGYEVGDALFKWLTDRYATPFSDPDEFIKLRGGQGYKEISTGYIWKVDKKHKDHFDVIGRKNKKVMEVSFDDRKIWPDGKKNKNKKKKKKKK
jgi:hypothetical protein